MRAARERHRARDGIDGGRARAIAQGHAAVAPPARRLELDIGEADLVRQQRREQHPIVGEPRLGADHGDGMAAERTPGQLLDQTRRGHPVANHDEGFAQSRFLTLAECAAVGRAALVVEARGGRLARHRH